MEYGHTEDTTTGTLLCAETGEEAFLATVSYSDILYCSECREVDPEVTVIA